VNINVSINVPRLDMGCEGLSGFNGQGFLWNKHMVTAEEALDDVNICSSAVNQR